jgi:hypothetical protein
MTDKLYKDLFDLYHRDLKLMSRLIYDWSGITIPIKVAEYNNIVATISVFPQLVSYLCGHLLQTHNVHHDPGYVKIQLEAPLGYKTEIYDIYRDEHSENHNISFNLSLRRSSLSFSKYINSRETIDLDRIITWKIVDRKYIDHNKYRADSKKQMSTVDYEKLIPLYFSANKDIPELVSSVIDILPILDNSIRELESSDVYIFPRFVKYDLDHVFRAVWDIFIIPDTVCIVYDNLAMSHEIQSPYIRLSIFPY